MQKLPRKGEEKFDLAISKVQIKYWTEKMLSTSSFTEKWRQDQINQFPETAVLLESISLTYFNSVPTMPFSTTGGGRRNLNHDDQHFSCQRLVSILPGSLRI